MLRCVVVESLVGALENVGDSFPVLKIDSFYGSIHDDVFHVSVNKPNDVVGLSFIRVVLLICPFNNGVLAIVVEDEKVGGLLELATVVDQEPLEFGVP